MKPTSSDIDRAPVRWHFFTIGLGILGGTSPFAGVNIGRGGLKGMTAYEQGLARADTMEEREAEQADTGAYRKANLGLEAKRWSDSADEARARLKQQGDIADRTNQREVARDKETAEFHRGELGDRAQLRQIERDRLNKGYFEPAAPVMKDGKPVLDESGAPMYTWVDRQNGTTKQMPYSPDTGLGRRGAGMSSATQWKYNAWLHAHEGDEQGALDFAGGHRQMNEADVGKAAHSMASKDYHDLFVAGSQPPPKDPEAWLRDKREEYAGQLRTKAPAAQPGAAQTPVAAAPTVTSKEEFDGLPSGTEYIGIDGGRYRKP